MPRRSAQPLPSVARVLAELGQNIRLARQRRVLTAQLVAERAGMSRTTLRSIERGDAAVTVGAIANVLDTLGLVQQLGMVARDDQLGRKLVDAQLELKQRARRSSTSKTK